jgi:hypothetical protein
MAATAQRSFSGQHAATAAARDDASLEPTDSANTTTSDNNLPESFLPVFLHMAARFRTMTEKVTHSDTACFLCLGSRPLASLFPHVLNSPLSFQVLDSLPRTQELPELPDDVVSRARVGVMIQYG